MRRLLAVVALAASLFQTSVAQAEPLVIAHRGASGYRPEHTAQAYELAISQGADFVEPDLVMTRDGVLVARHENELGLTTDVAARPEFADRRTTRTLEGFTFTGWFVEDFTLAELKTLRTRERRPQVRTESARYDGQGRILTLQEIIDIARRGASARGREVGLYIELKNPDYFAGLGLHMAPALAQVLQANGLDKATSPVIVESFFPSALIALRKLAPVRLAFLINSEAPPAGLLEANGIKNWSDVYSPEGLKRVAAFADVVAPEIQLILPRDDQGRSRPASRFVSDARAAGLQVHAWSVSIENAELPRDLRAGDPADPAAHGDGVSLARSLFEAGVDGVFTDYPDLVVKARRAALRGSGKLPGPPPAR